MTLGPNSTTPPLKGGAKNKIHLPTESDTKTWFYQSQLQIETKTKTKTKRLS